MGQYRRDFLRLGGIAAAGLLSEPAHAGAAVAPDNPLTARAMPTRNLGKTGYKAGIFSLGGQAALERGHNEAVAVPIIEKALDLGVNYIDTSSIYGGPERWSERYIGQVMKRRRARGLPRQQDQGTHARRLAADAGEIAEAAANRPSRPVAAARHRQPEDVDAIFAKGGAMEALLQAREQKMVRYLGITGHFRPEAADGSHPPLSVRHHPDGGQRRRPASLQLHGQRCCRWRSRNKWASSA